jgi:hypothetical protein
MTTIQIIYLASLAVASCGLWGILNTIRKIKQDPLAQRIEAINNGLFTAEQRKEMIEKAIESK